MSLRWSQRTRQCGNQSSRGRSQPYESTQIDSGTKLSIRRFSVCGGVTRLALRKCQTGKGGSGVGERNNAVNAVPRY
jgi:hypothetical protein